MVSGAAQFERGFLVLRLGFPFTEAVGGITQCGAMVAIHAHQTVTMRSVCRGVLGVVHRDLVMVNPQSVTLSVSVGEQSTLQHLIGRKTDAGDISVGRNISIKCVKNKCGKNGRSANFFYAFVNYGEVRAYMTDVSGQIVDLAMKFGLVERKGAWYSYGETRVGGMDNFVSELTKTGKIRELENDVYSEMDNEDL